MADNKWPDQLNAPSGQHLEEILHRFWQQLNKLPDLIQNHEHLLAHRCIAQLHDIVIEMVLAANGIEWPADTRHLNLYLGDTQRIALEKVLLTPTVHERAWIGAAVALVVIYHWYAPQITAKFQLDYPHDLEGEVWEHLQQQISAWPAVVSSP